MSHTPIFITGTGRSGTWILYKVLGCHQDVHTFPKEMRFLIDPDGLLDLIYALTEGYHPAKASEALYRFERLMLVYLAEPDRRPYRGFNLPAWIGPEFYVQRLREFLRQLADHEYRGLVWHTEPQHEGRLVKYAREIQSLRYAFQSDRFLPYRITLPRESSKVAHYFSDRRELLNLSAGLVNDLFCHAANQNGKQSWAEKTPQHLLFLDFIWELFPDAAVIHIKRDPRGIVHSLTKQPWAPQDVSGSALWLRNVFERWFEMRETLLLDSKNYLELKLEDFALAPRNCMSQVVDVCGLTDEFTNLPEISLNRVTYWQNDMSRYDQRIVEETLGPYLVWMGYEA